MASLTPANAKSRRASHSLVLAWNMTWLKTLSHTHIHPNMSSRAVRLSSTTAYPAEFWSLVVILSVLSNLKQKALKLSVLKQALQKPWPLHGLPAGTHSRSLPRPSEPQKARPSIQAQLNITPSGSKKTPCALPMRSKYIKGYKIHGGRHDESLPVHLNWKHGNPRVSTGLQFKPTTQRSAVFSHLPSCRDILQTVTQPLLGLPNVYKSERCR